MKTASSFGWRLALGSTVIAALSCFGCGASLPESDFGNSDDSRDDTAENSEITSRCTYPLVQMPKDLFVGTLNEVVLHVRGPCGPGEHRSLGSCGDNMFKVSTSFLDESIVWYFKGNELAGVMRAFDYEKEPGCVTILYGDSCTEMAADSTSSSLCE